MDNNGYPQDMVYGLDNKPAREHGFTKYRVLAILFCLLSVGGLFLGMIPHLGHAQFQSPSGNVFDASLLGILINVFKNISGVFDGIKAYFQMGSEGISLGIWTIAEYLFLLLAVLSVIASLVTVFFTFFAKKLKTARKAALAGGLSVLIGYGGFFFAAYIMGSAVVGQIAASLFDIPSAIIAGATLLILAIWTIVRLKGRGIINVLLFLFMGGAFFFLFFPKTIIGEYAAQAFGFTTSTVFLKIALTLAVVMSFYNLIATAIRMQSKKGFTFEIICFVVQTILAVLVVIAFLVTPPDGLDNAAVFGWPSTLPTILVIFFPLAAMQFAIISQIKHAMSMRKEQPAAQPEAAQAYPQENYPQYPQENYPQEGYTQDYQEYPQENYPEYAEEQNGVVADEETSYTANETEPAVETVPVQPPVQPSNEPVVVKEVIREIYKDPAADKATPTPSEFEQRMAALARGEAPAPDQSQQSSLYANQPRYNRPYPNEGYQGTYRPTGSTPQSNYVFDGSQYTYDPFINTLTPAEKNEFGDIFIANIYGIRSNLPTYVIGGDNKEFFQTVFIYLGRFRSFITPELMEKMYTYANKM